MKKILIIIVAVVLSACCEQTQSTKQADGDSLSVPQEVEQTSVQAFEEKQEVVDSMSVPQGVEQSSAQYVDLGLSVKWATCNVGAKNPYEKGNYYSFDAAQKLGRVPTREQFQELLDKCTWKWTQMSGVNGYKVTAKNGNSIFLPAAGYLLGTDVYNVGSYGYYWSSSAYSSRIAYCLSFYGDGASVGNNGRYYGQSVRLVRGS